MSAEVMDMSVVTGFQFGFSNSTLRLPYALAVLSCGHVSKCDVHPSRYACGGCGVETRRIEAVCECGYRGYRILEIADPHKPEFRATQVGDTVECSSCDSEARQLEWLRNLPVKDVQHARYRVIVGSPSYCFYGRDEKSPTGVLLIGSVAATPAIEALLRQKRMSPLSPTEAA
jgi:hypothetical protein